jgi:hypothetical protein
MFVPGLTIEVEMEGRSCRELDRPFSESAETEFWSLEVSENANWSTRRALYLSDCRKPGVVVVMGAMAEVESKDVDARLEQRADLIGG